MEGEKFVADLAVAEKTCAEILLTVSFLNKILIELFSKFHFGSLN